MEGIPAPDVADYTHRKEIELGHAAGSISQPPLKRTKIENCPLTEEELRRQFAEHKALMELNAPETSAPAESSSSGAVYGTPQTYATPPALTGPPMASIPPHSCQVSLRGMFFFIAWFSCICLYTTTFRISYARLPAGCSSFPPRPSPIPNSTFPAS